MRFKMQSFAESGVLAGALPGQKVFGEMIAATTPPSGPEVCFVDFANVDVATTSFLRESLLAYRNHARSHWANIYPVAANLGPSVREELEHFLNDQGNALVTCSLDPTGSVSEVRVLGRLDEKQESALRAVIREGEVDAPTLAERYKKKDAVSPTAWNNRLVALAMKGLLIELSIGRGKRYRPVLEQLSYGT